MGQKKDISGGSFRYGPTAFLQLLGCPAWGSLRHSAYRTTCFVCLRKLNLVSVAYK